MTNMENELRALLQSRAAEVPRARAVPRSLRGRARRRIAINALAMGAAAVLVAGGAYAGLRAVGGTERPKGAGVPPAVEKSPSPIHESPSAVKDTPPSATPKCTSGRLRAVASMEGAAGSREGAIDLTNFSDVTCTLEGTPALQLLDQNLDPITSGVEFDSAPAGWSVNGSPEPPGWPLVTLRPGDSAAVRIRWSNWCSDTAPLWRVQIPSSGSVDVNGMDAVAPPPCNGPGQPSTIEVGPFEPAGS
jgi:hypothetical protein